MQSEFGLRPTFKGIVNTDGSVAARSNPEQQTSFATGVTVNASSALLTTQAADTTAGGSSTITITDDRVAADSIIFASIVDYAGTVDATALPTVVVDSVAAGSFDLVVHNEGSGALDSVLKIAFEVI